MIEALYNLGDDALGNFFEVTIPAVNVPGGSGTQDMQNIILRSTDINIPQSGSNSYDINYKTQKIQKVGGKVDLTQTFSMTFRVDRQYTEYVKLLRWKNAIANPHTGIIGDDSISTTGHRVDITVHPINSDGQQIEGSLYWILHYAYLKTIPDIRFDYTAGEPVTVALTFEFTTLEEINV